MRKSIRVLSLIIGLTLVLALGLSACGGGSGSGKVKLTMVESLTSPQRSEILKAMIAEYEENNPNVTIELISPPMDGADQKIREMLMNKNDMDILEVRDWTVKEFTDNDYLESLAGYIDNWSDKGTLSSTFHETSTRIGGDYYLIPYGFYEKMIYYRADWLEEAGIPVPTNWDEVVEASIAVTDPSAGRYGWTLRGASGGTSILNKSLIDTLGSDRVVADDNMFTKTGETIYATPEALECFNQIIRLYNEGSPRDSVNWGFQDQCQAFTSGVTGFLWQDPEVVAICSDSMEDGTWSTIPDVVSAASGQCNMGVGFAGWGITSFSKHKDEAFDFISFISNPENNATFCEGYSVIPIHTNASEINSFFESGPFAPYNVMNTNPDTYFITYGPENYAENTEFGLTADKEFQQVLQGELSPEDALAKWDAFWAALK